jgi:hypothetical protein
VFAVSARPARKCLPDRLFLVVWFGRSSGYAAGIVRKLSQGGLIRLHGVDHF